MLKTNLKTALLAGLALLIASLILASGSFYLYLKIQGKNTDHFVNQSIEFITQHIPLIGDSKIELQPLASALTVFPVDSISFQEINLTEIPATLAKAVRSYTESHNPANSNPASLKSVVFPVVLNGEEELTKAYLIPYELSGDETLLNKVFSAFDAESFEISSEIFAGYETLVLNEPDQYSYYLCRISTDFLLVTKNKQALAKLLRQEEGVEHLADKIVLKEDPSYFYKSYQEGSQSTDILQKLERFSNFYLAENTSTYVSEAEKGLLFEKEFTVKDFDSKPFQANLAVFSPKESIFYFEAYNLKSLAYPLLESNQEEGYPVRAKDLVKDFNHNYDLDLEKDLLTWMNRNYSLSITPVSDSSSFTYAFTLLLKVDEQEEALLGLEKAEKALEEYFVNSTDDPEQAITYTFVDQELGDLKLRSIALYPEFGLHYTFLDPEHLLISSHLEGIEAFSNVRPDQDSLATRNSFQEATSYDTEGEVINLAYWDVRESYDFVAYLLDKYLEDAKFLTDFLAEIDTIGQVSKLDTNFIKQEGVISF